jgi:hypothetical protein
MPRTPVSAGERRPAAAGRPLPPPLPVVSSWQGDPSTADFFPGSSGPAGAVTVVGGWPIVVEPHGNDFKSLAGFANGPGAATAGRRSPGLVPTLRGSAGRRHKLMAWARAMGIAAAAGIVVGWVLAINGERLVGLSPWAAGWLAFFILVGAQAAALGAGGPRR